MRSDLGVAVRCKSGLLKGCEWWSACFWSAIKINRERAVSHRVRVLAKSKTGGLHRAHDQAARQGCKGLDRRGALCSRSSCQEKIQEEVQPGTSREQRQLV